MTSDKASLIDRVDKAALPGKDDNRVIIREFEGYMIHIGLNALSNERIVSHHPHEECLWVHALGSRGSHVVVCHSGLHASFPDEVVRLAATLALKYSRSKGKSVNCSRLNNVIKPSGAGVGVFHPTKTVQIDL
jgi:predicted ribosome quality control (RQC) complex YloA/Tae2 family protein